MSFPRCPRPERLGKQASFSSLTSPFLTDTPSFSSVCRGNTGTVNSFTGVDIADLTGGVVSSIAKKASPPSDPELICSLFQLNAETLLQGNNLICFAFAAARQGVPSVLGGVVTLVGNALGFLDSKLNTILPGLGCPELDKFNLGVFSQFPGSG